MRIAQSRKNPEQQPPWQFFINLISRGDERNSYFFRLLLVYRSVIYLFLFSFLCIFSTKFYDYSVLTYNVFKTHLFFPLPYKPGK